jgi:hypothetical protein
MNSTLHDPTKLWGTVTVTNHGRRPIYITSVSLALPRHLSDEKLLLVESLKGQRLGEGDAPATFVIDQANMQKERAPHWKKIRPVVHDSAGKKYTGPRVKERPSWANPN